MRKILSFLMALILIVSLIPSQTTHAKQIFSDVPTSHDYYDEIMYLLENDVIVESSKYGLNDIVTREDVAVMVAKAVGLDGTPRATKFKDVNKSNPNSGYIQSAADEGILGGYLDGTFKPKTKVTRGQMAVFIANAFDLPNGDKAFKDVKPGQTGYDQIKKLVSAGITSGYADGTFKPVNNLTRAHISLFLVKAMKFENGEATVPSNTKEMKVHFIDVGQGDSILVELATGETVLIDGGPKSAGDEVVTFIKSKGITKLDYVIATHPDADHVGGLSDVLKTFPVDTFINSGKEHTTDTYYELLNLVKEKKITYVEPNLSQVFEYDPLLDSYFQILYVNSEAVDNNDASIVVKAGLGETDFLFMSDASTEIENTLVYTYDTVDVDILKAGHHGSDTSSSLSFLNAVSPEATILSYGIDNSYGHPNATVVSNLKTVGSKIYSTAQDGSITITTNGSKYEINSREFTGNGNVTAPKPIPTPVEPKPEPSPQPQPEETQTYKNCTELREDYPKGVSKGHPAYDKKFDRDGDGKACE
ncbi:S-layer homology domain-containing protein [Ureibacillus composti]